MTGVIAIVSSKPPTNDVAKQPVDWRLEQLIDRLPVSLRSRIRWLRQPSSRWARIPAGALLILGGLLSILPVLGLWMLPLGLALLAEDAPPLRRARDRLLDWIERRWPNFMSGAPTIPAAAIPSSYRPHPRMVRGRFKRRRFSR
jgi:hypothetical protein